MNKTKKQEGTPMYARIHWMLTQARLSWLLTHEAKPITGLDLLDIALSTARVILHSGDRAMLIDWLGHALIPSLREVLEWAEEQIEEARNDAKNILEMTSGEE